MGWDGNVRFEIRGSGCELVVVMEGCGFCATLLCCDVLWCGVVQCGATSGEAGDGNGEYERLDTCPEYPAA